jgi:hypothetical protein
MFGDSRLGTNEFHGSYASKSPCSYNEMLRRPCCRGTHEPRDDVLFPSVVSMLSANVCGSFGNVGTREIGRAE